MQCVWHAIRVRFDTDRGTQKRVIHNTHGNDLDAGGKANFNGQIDGQLWFLPAFR